MAEDTSKLSLEKAINIALQNNYDIQKQQLALSSAKAQYRIAASSLDLEGGAQAQYSMKQNPVDKEDPNYIVADNIFSDNTLTQQSGASLYLKKLFSFGLESKLSYTIQRVKNNPDYEYSKNYTGSKLTDEDARNTGEIALELSLPLFKSFKDSITALKIEAAHDYIEQMEYELSDTVAKTFITVSSQYWKYLLDYRKMMELENLQNEIEERNKSMDSLIKAGVRSKNDLLALQVSVNENRRSLQDSKVQFNQSKMELITTLGISAKDFIGDPEESFGDLNLEDVKIPLESDLDEDFFNNLEEKRTDIKFLKKKVDLAEKKVRMAQVDKRPDASLNFGIGTGGAAYSNSFGDTIASPFKNVQGVNINGALGISAKLGNNAKKGALEECQAEYEACLTDYIKAKNTLILQIKNSIDKLDIYRNMVRDADNVLKLQKDLYENERKRFTAGLITVDNLLNQDQKFVTAELSYYQVLINCMQAILEYKYYASILF